MSKLTKWAGALLLVSLFACGTFWLSTKHNANASPQKKVHFTIPEPLFLVPGTGGEVDRFDDLITTLKKTSAGIDVLKLTVKTDDSIKVSGKLTKQTTHPIIVVAFEDASDPALPQQSRWFQEALTYVHERYGFETYNYLGHSNGGLIATGYLQNNRLPEDPKLDHLVTLGTPYNDVGWEYNENNNSFVQPKDISPLFERYLQKAKELPKDIKVFNVIGNVDEKNSDEVVPMTSVLAGRTLYGESDLYQELVFNEDAEHSALVENDETIKLIQDFLFE